MSINKIISYIAVIVIGVGFIMMAISNMLRSEIASILQGLLGGVFIVLGLYKSVSEIKQNKWLYCKVSQI